MMATVWSGSRALQPNRSWNGAPIIQEVRSALRRVTGGYQQSSETGRQTAGGDKDRVETASPAPEPQRPR